MNFENEINDLENQTFKETFIAKMGDIPILFTAVHTMEQRKKDGIIKLKEPYTKAIALYLNQHYGASYMIKIKDDGFDSNQENHDPFKKELIQFVKKNHIKLILDLHGARKEREFDVEFGTLNNLTADFSTLKELEEALKEKGIFNISYNQPFKGGAITKCLFHLKEVEVIQLEINQKYRDQNDLKKLELLCDALGTFIEQYQDYKNR